MRRLLLVFLILILVAAGLVGVARLTSKSIDGIGCDFSEGSGYHVHALLTVVIRGRIVHPPAGIGIEYLHMCLYWVHTHDATGVIHIEAPHGFTPTVRNFFDIWGQPLGAHQIWQYRVPSARSLRVFVDNQQVVEEPGRIKLREHTAVTIEIGPPFIPPPVPNFTGSD